MEPSVIYALAGYLLVTSPACSGQAVISLGQTAYAVHEGEQFTVTLQKTGIALSSINVVVEVGSDSHSGSQDFIGTSQTTVFEAGIEAVVKKVIFTVKDEEIPEGDETYVLQVRVTNGDGIVGLPARGTVTIIANDEGFGIFGFITPSPMVTDEFPGDYTISLNIQRTQGTYDEVAVEYEVMGSGGGVAGQNLSPATGQVQFADGESLKQLQLTVIDDQVPENDETFTVRLVAVTGGLSVNPTSNRPKLTPDMTEVTVVIRKNDAPIRFSQVEYRVDEDSYDVTLQVTIYRGLDQDGLTVIGPVNRPATVNYYFLSGTATVTTDFHGTNGSIGFSSGTMETTVTVQIVSDILPEVAEQFQIVLSETSGDVVLAYPYITTVTINANDDFNGVLSLKSTNGQMYPVVRVDEDAVSTVNDFSIVRNGGLYGTVSIQWILLRNDSNADPVNIDVLPTAGTVTFTEGVREKPIVFSITQDNSPEPAERYLLLLLPETVTGGGRAEGILQGELVIEDSDGAYGIVQFTADNAQFLVTDTNPRRLRLSLTRTAGTLGNVNVDFAVTYSSRSLSASDVLSSKTPGTAVFPAGLSSHSFDVLIKNEAFLEVGAEFQITLTAVTLSQPDDVGPFNTPMLGPKTKTSVVVSPAAANGEVGFASIEDVLALEPPLGEAKQQVFLPLRRDGTNGDVQVSWSMSGGGDNPDHVTPQDVQPASGTITIPSGQATGSIVLDILGDDLPETDEVIVVLLTQVAPVETQRLRPGAAQIKVIILENDNPGGVFEFGPDMNRSYVVKEEEDAIEVTIIRSGSALVYREVEYYIEPNGDEEFYGGLNVVKFFPGEVEKQVTVLAKKDEMAELTETFLMKLRSFGEREATIGPRSLINITVLTNENPFGLFQFPSKNYTVYTDESKGDTISLAQLVLQRAWGRFGMATIDWYVVDAENNTDLAPLSGTLTFNPGEGEKFINIAALADDIPEQDETYTVVIENPTGQAILGSFTQAYVTISKNDDAIFVKEPSEVRVSEPGQHTFTIVRDGPRDVIVSVSMRTADGTAMEGGRDFVAIPAQTLLFDIGEFEKTVTVTVLEDTMPEPEETFYLELFDPQGDVAVFGRPATIFITANDMSNGIFSFVPPFSLTVEEGETAKFPMKREQGHFNEAKVYYDIYHNDSGLVIPSRPGREDFAPNATYVQFRDLQQLGYLEITPTSDGVPEYSEKFTIRLTRVEGGPPDDQGQLATTNLEVYLEVLKNDDPNGVFQFRTSSREISIAEDYMVGDEDMAVARFVVERKQGTFGVVEVAWEVYSYQIAGAGNLPDFVDLLFLATIPPSVREVPEKRRTNTGTKTLQFTACPACYLTIPAEYQPEPADIMDGFSISAWFQAAPNTDGILLAKTSSDGATTYYSVKLRVDNSPTFSSAFIEFRYSVATNPTSLVVSRSTNVDLADGKWHFLLLTIDQGNVTYYVDGTSIGVSRLAATSLLDARGLLWVGASPPGISFLNGVLQDVRIYNRRLDEGEIRELYESPSKNDISPTSGYIYFYDTPSSVQETIVIGSTDDVEEESNDVFSVKLVSVKGGGRISSVNNAAVLTVLKSDNSNGLFGFSGPCLPESAEREDTMFNCPVERLRGDADSVTLVWEIHQMASLGGSYVGIASTDFVNETGAIIFQPGERQKTISFQVADDNDPEITEYFEVRITDLRPGDGLAGTTTTSGASVKPGAGARNITVLASDHPYGLFQFGLDGTPPANDDPMVPAALEALTLTVAEEVGMLTLLVVRAQGLLGEVSVEWRTVDGSARSSGKTPADYIAAIGRLTFAPGQRSATIQIQILDNEIPESEKYFVVELVNPTNGGSVGLGSRLAVTIQHSDQAYGVFQFAEFSLFTTAQESRSEEGENFKVTLKVVREGGAIGQVNVTWQVTDDTDDDIMESFGYLTFDTGQQSSEFVLRIRDDLMPELDEIYHVQLLQVSLGSLGEEGKLQASITVIGNDDPYGVFVIAADNRPIYVEETFQEVAVTIERVANSGTFGTVRVDYSTLRPWESYPYLPGGTRAGPLDYSNSTGSVVIGPGNTTAAFNVTVRDDLEPEVDETFFVRLTGAYLIQGEQSRIVQDSPRLGPVTECYSQIIISANDNPSGVLQLSNDAITVSEEFTGVLTSVVRSGGAFGSVTVKFEVGSGSATYGLDYSVSSTDVVLISGEREKRVPVDIINDRLPELEETFSIRLVEPVAGGAMLGPVTETVVTILSSDDPHGAFGFESPSMSVEEPAIGRSAPVEIPVVRTGGTLGVVTVNWHARLNGKVLPPVNTSGAPDIDISPTSGAIYFVSNEARQMISLSVLADSDPEGTEDIMLILTSANNNGRILSDKANFTLSILPNDNPHGTVEFSQAEFVISEVIGQDSTQTVPVSRVGGSYGQLKVYYLTRELDILEEATSGGRSVFQYYTMPRAGKPLPQAGTSWNVKNQPDPLKACSQFCLLSEACKSFDYNPTRVDCNWFTTGDFQWLDNRTGYVYYSKIQDLTAPLYTVQAKSGVDYIEVQPEKSILIDNGQTVGALPVQVLSDDLPELNEKFKIELTKVELVGGPPLNPSNIPQLGANRQASVVIGLNDDANGVFRIYSNDPRALEGGQNIPVEERAKFSVELVVERQGGSIGTVSVEWYVDITRTTATKGADFIADGATLTFLPGDLRRTVTIGIEDDEVPENDETILVGLREPGGGSVIGQNNAVTIVVMANDYVAGLLSFSQTSYLVKEGDVMGLTIRRSAPALGRVTCDWIIRAVNSQPPAVRFRIHTGTLFFDQGVQDREVLLHVLVDNEPKINQEYVVEIVNVRTEGVRSSGAAAVDPQNGRSVITIEGGNEPHGVFSFATTSLERRVIEGNTMAQLTVDRKFGSIGIVRIYYDVKGGSVRPPDENTVPANPNTDFTSVAGGHITMYDGENSAAITVGLMEDDIPEVDEIFLVNLTRVDLIEPKNSTFRPRLATMGTVAEVIINANDGTQGEVMFTTAALDAQEFNRNISLTVRRDKGTFGEVSVFCFAQSSREGATRGEDFNFDPRDIHFGPGVAEQTVVIAILEDSVPEPDESFDIILASPKNGLTVGTPGKVTITILASDLASGVVNFDSVANVTINEPADNSASTNSVARLRLVRAPGIFGVVNVPFRVERVGGRPGELVTDLIPSTGYVTFQDREGSTMLELTAVPDDEPEEAEAYLVSLQAPEGGADLGPANSLYVIIERNDAPYGMLEILPAGSSDTSINVEETAGTIYFTVTRSQGSMDRISVDMVTSDGTAKAIPGNRFTLSTVQQIGNLEVSRWQGFSAHGLSYAILLNDRVVGPMVTTVGSDGASVSTTGVINPSILYRWQGSLVQVQTIETDGAKGAASMTIGSQTYLIIANHGSYNRHATKSRLYLVQENGPLTVVQDLNTIGATDGAFFKKGDKTFLVIANYQNNQGQTGVMSYVYQWEATNNKFGSLPIQFLATKGAIAVDSLEVDGIIFVAIANHFDSESRAYELKSIIYKLDSDDHLTIHQQVDTHGAVDLTFFKTRTDSYLVIANGQDNIGNTQQDLNIYSWNSLTQLWTSIQKIRGNGIEHVGVFNMDNGMAYLVIASKSSPSAVYAWDESMGQFNMTWQGSQAMDMHPLEVEQSAGHHVAMVTAPLYNSSGVLQFSVREVNLLGDSDYIPRSVTLTFVPGQTELTTSVTILDDLNAEDTETFFVELTNPRQGAELGPRHEVSVHILSNDDGHGIVEFADDSLERREEETPGADNLVQINVVRRRGSSGRVVVRWTASGAHQGALDIFPVEGKVEFANDQAAATITITIRDDNLSEMDELSYLTLTEVVEKGTSLPNRGAKIGANNVCRLTVLANDSPYGVVLWEKATYLVAEPEGGDSTVLLHLTRRQGSLGHIRVTYMTLRAVTVATKEQAVSGEDYVAQQATVDMRENVTRIPVEITILTDSAPEVTEIFWVNITSVQLIGVSGIQQGSAPSVRRPGDIAVVTITENDNARGVVQFSITKNIENRVDVYEGIGQVRLKLSRTVGLFGEVEVSWQASPREADTDDFTPSGGIVRFKEGQQEAFIVITIVDDTLPEDLQTFDVQLIRVTSGGASIGSDQTVRVGILRNDSPNGVFSFETIQVTVRESQIEFDPSGRVTLTIVRRGTDGVVNVDWRLGADAVYDFNEPLMGTVRFGPGESRKQITLVTKPDNQLEGQETFTVSLVAVDNNAIISPTEGDATVVILPDPGAGGTVSITPGYRRLVMGEPTAGYDGMAEIQLARAPGVYGEVKVTWQILKRDLTAFLQTSGEVVFEDMQGEAYIVIQAGDDSIPELRQKYTLELTSANGGATIDMSARTVDITIVASDYPHGLFEFTQPSEIVVQEDHTSVTVPVVRNYGLDGQVRVLYTTSSGTATSFSDPPDFRASSGAMTFSSGQARQTVVINIVDDVIAEGPERFFVNITAVELLYPVSNNYTLISGLRLDQAPAVGPQAAKTIVIDKNDNAEGFVEFPEEALNFIAYEDVGVAAIPVIRGPGMFGDVAVRYRAEDISATSNVDYILYAGEIIIPDGVARSTINVTIIDDMEMEFTEQFMVKLTDTRGGAVLGKELTSVVTIAKSDYPNGKFSFVGQTLVTIPNPDTTTTITLTIERSGGLLGSQTLRWRIMGPNNPNRKLEETNDVSFYNAEGREETEGFLVWAANTGGQQSFSLTVKPHTGWEVAKTFAVTIYDIQGFPANSGSGEASKTSGNFTLIVAKFGHPNGIVRFEGLAQVERTFEEPASGMRTLTFPIVRREGTVGNIDVHFKVVRVPAQPSGEPPDFKPMEGVATIVEDTRTGAVVLELLADDISELEETFRLQLTQVDGGAEVDTLYNSSIFKVKHNDFPHGRFSIDSDYQTVIVGPSSLERQLLLNITRNNGAFGRVRISFGLIYDQPTQSSEVETEAWNNYFYAQSGISYLPSSGSVTFDEGQSEAMVPVDIESTVYLELGSTFTVTLTEARYIGVGATTQPELMAGQTVAKVKVPQEAANSEVGFLNTVVTVDEETNLVEMTLERRGSYGTVHVDWMMASPAPELTKFKAGAVNPDSGTVSMANGVSSGKFTVQVSPRPGTAELFEVRLPRPPTASVKGGARLRPGFTTCRIDPHGVVQFGATSRTVGVAEQDEREVEVTLQVVRMYGSEDAIQIRYGTFSGTASAELDFKEINNGAITMNAAQYETTVFVMIKSDTIPETDEVFYLNFTSVSRLPTDTSQNVSPRLSELYSSSTITIRQNSDPYGVLSLDYEISEPDGKASEPGSVKLLISRTGGSFGRVSVQVRTVGGGEQWDRFVDMTPGGSNQTIGQVLGNREISRAAMAGQDYQPLEKTVEFKEDETTVEVTLYIIEDSRPEDDEYVFVYLAPQTDDVRVAQPAVDQGRKGYAVIPIRRNDYWNGWVGFYAANSSRVPVDEDSGTPAILTVERQNASFGELTVSWRAVVSPGSMNTVNERIDLATELSTLEGRVLCAKGHRFCTFPVSMRDDSFPENQTWFLVELFLNAASQSGAQIDASRKYANVTVLGSDGPNGKLQFDDNSRYLYLERGSRTVALRVERVGYQGKTLVASYSTQQLEQEEYIAGVRVLPALGGSDYNTARGYVTFNPGVRSQTIQVTLDPTRASDQPYPKMFRVALSDVTNNGELGERIASVTLVEVADTVVWEVWPRAQGPLTNSTINTLMDDLSKAVTGSLAPTQLTITKGVLDKVLTVAENSPLQEGVRSSIMNVLCKLLDPSRQDATRGHWQLSKTMERFAYSLVSHLKCDTCCQQTFLFSPVCPYARFVVAKRYPDDINGYTWTASQQDEFTIPSNLLSENSQSSSTPRCYPLALVEYYTEHWFTRGSNQLLNNKVFSASIKNRPSRSQSQPARFTVHTPERKNPAKRAECVYFDETSGQWTTGNKVCSVTNSLILATDPYLNCECYHMSLYAVRTDVKNPGLIGYPIWFYISCFICMAGLALAIISHHACPPYAMYAASLLMHMMFAVMATEICYVIDAFLSPSHILFDLDPGDNNHRCIVMSVFLHYFFLTQFTWMMTQAINFYKILVLNDEHTERKHVIYFLIGWVLPVLLVALFYLTAYLVYRFTEYGLVQFIYGDVLDTRDICFVTNPYAGMAGVVVPSLLCLMVVGIVFVQAFQVTPQWQAYDDVYRGRYNIHEVRNLLVFWALIVITWLWGGLHMAYGQLWMLALFCIFNILVGLYAFIMYAVLRNPCPCCPTLGKPEKALYNINTSLSNDSDSPYHQPQPPSIPVPSLAGSVKGSKHSLVQEQPWEDKGSLSRQSHLRVKRSAVSGNIYVIPPTTYEGKPASQPTEDHDSQDFDDLIYALKSGTSNPAFSASDQSHTVDREVNTIDAPNSPYERRRINIADTHL